MKYFKKSEMEIHLNQLFAFEKKNTAAIIEALCEVQRRKMYLEFGCTSLFGMLTKYFRYPSATAQVWVENVRLTLQVPEIKEDIKAGTLHTSQVSLVAKAIREKKKQIAMELSSFNKTKSQLIFDSGKKPNPNQDDSKQSHASQESQKQIDPRKLINQVKNQTVADTQIILAQSLDLEIKTTEKKRLQKNESVRIELTLSKEQMLELEKVKQIFSHSHPSLTMAELISLMAKEIIKRKSPDTEKRKYVRKENRFVRKENKLVSSNSRHVHMNSEISSNDNLTSETEYAAQKFKSFRSIPAATKRFIYQRDQQCQHPDCDSKFQLQMDHKIPIWSLQTNEQMISSASYTYNTKTNATNNSISNKTNEINDPANLQLLCAEHNRMKYRREVGLK